MNLRFSKPFVIYEIEREFPEKNFLSQIIDCKFDILQMAFIASISQTGS